jgi:hypothetical protein
MSEQFRTIARGALKRAKAEINSENKDRLIYAALNLRMAIEALTYDRAKAYEQELPESTYSTWQPKQLMSKLLEIDATADQGGTLAVGLEKIPGVPAERMQVIGSEYILSLKTIKEHYDALGAYLHIPTIKQLRGQKAPQLDRLKTRCELIIEEVDKALKSNVFNVVFRVVASVDCRRCRNTIDQRVPSGEFDFEIACRNCCAPYRMQNGTENQVAFQALTTNIECLNKDCIGKHELWKDQLIDGYQWICDVCALAHKIGFKVYAPLKGNGE